MEGVRDPGSEGARDQGSEGARERGRERGSEGGREGGREAGREGEKLNADSCMYRRGHCGLFRVGVVMSQITSNHVRICHGTYELSHITDE